VPALWSLSCIAFREKSPLACMERDHYSPSVALLLLDLALMRKNLDDNTVGS
jgi:hypothetical protein